jgi:hypothetical protein
MKLLSATLVTAALLFSTNSYAEEEGVAVGTASVLQLQIGGQDNRQESLIGVMDSEVDDGFVLVGNASVVQVQTDGHDNVQRSSIGTRTEAD